MDVEDDENLLGGFLGLLLLLLNLVDVLVNLIGRKEGQSSLRAHDSDLHVLRRLNDLQKGADGELDGTVLVSDVFYDVVVLEELIDGLEALSNANSLPLGESSTGIGLVESGLAVIESSQQCADTEGANTSTLGVFLG